MAGRCATSTSPMAESRRRGTSGSDTCAESSSRCSTPMTRSCPGRSRRRSRCSARTPRSAWSGPTCRPWIRPAASSRRDISGRCTTHTRSRTSSGSSNVLPRSRSAGVRRRRRSPPHPPTRATSSPRCSSATSCTRRRSCSAATGCGGSADSTRRSCTVARTTSSTSGRAAMDPSRSSTRRACAIESVQPTS